MDYDIVCVCGMPPLSLMSNMGFRDTLAVKRHIGMVILVGDFRVVDSRVAKYYRFGRSHVYHIHWILSHMKLYIHNNVSRDEGCNGVPNWFCGGSIGSCCPINCCSTFHNHYIAIYQRALGSCVALMCEVMMLDDGNHCQMAEKLV